MVRIHLDRNWQVIVAYLEAPYGSRLAEWLSHNELNLSAFRVPRSLRWYPQSDDINPAAYVEGEIPPTNDALNNVRANMGGGQ